MSMLHIKSDFNDYYDVLNSESCSITYNRYLRESKQRGTALKYLRNIGIKTLEIKQVSSFFRDDSPIVVYTDPIAHHGNGKKIMSVDEAQLLYSNYMASKYYQSDHNITLKFLQIGKRRFTLYFKKEEPISLNMGKLIDLRESTPEYNRLIGIPIFSIDYISNGNHMIATDFNEVEDLKALGVDKWLSADTVVTEIIDALAIYNKY
ncbi:MAG: hypothetical protein J6A59_09395 [Lachnospiraceae bacterium]|nr:hypothetical protein [Lachnospiraceae bacterium]